MLKTKFSLSANAFIFFISIYFSTVLDLKFWQYAFEKISIDSPAILIFVLTLPLFLFIPFFWLFNLTVWPRVGKPLVMVLMILSAASDYALQKLGVVIDSDMIRNLVETNLREASDYFVLPAFIYVLFLGILPAVAVMFTKINYAPLGKELRRRGLYILLGLLAVGISAAGTYKEYASFGRNNREVRYYINTFNYIQAVARFYKRSAEARRHFVILDGTPRTEPAADGKQRVVVLLVGETARAANFSLYGYDRNTNPLLSTRNDIITFRHVRSCGTATAFSLPCMFSAMPRKQFDSTDAKYTQNLADIAKAAGWNVFWKDNDDGCKRVCDRVENADAKDGNKQPWCFGDYCHDDILLDGLEERLQSAPGDKLIILHMMGSHGPSYYQRYPEKFKRFAPTCDTADLHDCTREQIINTYDNTIVYTDYIISSIIDILKRHPELESSMLYVSDHGESLGENNIYLHGLPYAIAPEEQKTVPMILWMSQNTEKALGENMSCLQKSAAEDDFSHDNYFHSVLRLLHIKTKTYNGSLDVFSKCSK